MGEEEQQPCSDSGRNFFCDKQQELLGQGAAFVTVPYVSSLYVLQKFALARMEKWNRTGQDRKSVVVGYDSSMTKSQPCNRRASNPRLPPRPVIHFERNE